MRIFVLLLAVLVLSTQISAKSLKSQAKLSLNKNGTPPSPSEFVQTGKNDSENKPYYYPNDVYPYNANGYAACAYFGQGYYKNADYRIIEDKYFGNYCYNNCYCDGNRTCSQSGWCQGTSR